MGGMVYYLDFIEVDQPALRFLVDPTERPLQNRSPAIQGFSPHRTGLSSICFERIHPAEA
jgi:hypothetical protein